MSNTTKEDVVSVTDFKFIDGAHGVWIGFNHPLHDDPEISEWIKSIDENGHMVSIDGSTVDVSEPTAKLIRSAFYDSEGKPDDSYTIIHVRLKWAFLEVKAETRNDAHAIRDKILKSNGYRTTNLRLLGNEGRDVEVVLDLSNAE